MRRHHEEEKVKDPRENEGGKGDGGKEGMGMGVPQIPPLKTSQATQQTERVSGVPPIGFSARDWDDVDYVQAGQILRYLDAAIEGNDQAGNIVFNLGGTPYLIRKLPRDFIRHCKSIIADDSPTNPTTTTTIQHIESQPTNLLHQITAILKASSFPKYQGADKESFQWILKSFHGLFDHYVIEHHSPQWHQDFPAWDLKDNTALNVLQAAVSDSIRDTIKSCNAAYEACQLLQQYHADQSPEHICARIIENLNLTMNGDESMNEFAQRYLTSLRDIQQLVGIEATADMDTMHIFSPQFTCYLWLHRLPKKLETYRSAIYAKYKGDFSGKWTPNFTIPQLMGEVHQQAMVLLPNNDRPSAFTAKESKKKHNHTDDTSCFYCGKKGHTSDECHKLAANTKAGTAPHCSLWPGYKGRGIGKKHKNHPKNKDKDKNSASSTSTTQRRKIRRPT
ncbi:hypothetical protein HK104_010462 [Borealophlyctis nickersoniae]|nr:hypothetical protein HK104_010462 [Borealophlyctis nickersoniae]